MLDMESKQGSNFPALYIVGSLSGESQENLPATENEISDTDNLYTAKLRQFLQASAI